MSVAIGAGHARSPRVLVSVTAQPALGVIVGHIDHLTDSGWDVHVLVGEPTDGRLLPRATVHMVPMARGVAWRHDFASYRAVRAAVATVRPDVVVGATPKAAVLALRAARRVGVEHRVWWVWGYRHEASINAVGRAVELDAGRTATQILAASASLAAVLHQRGLAATWLGVGGISGVDLDVFEPACGPESTPTGPAPTAVFAGRLSRDKGLDHLARIWPQVLATTPDARLLLAGESDSLDPADQAIAELTRLPGVEFLGYVDEMPRVLQEADVLVHPSRREGMPAVVLEAAACAVPAVVWDVTGSRDAVVDGLTGQVVPYGDERRFAATVQTLLTDPGLRAHLGAQARHRVAARFDRRDVEENFGIFLRGLLASTPAGQRAARQALPAQIRLNDPPRPREPLVLHSGAAPNPGPDRQG